MTNDVNETNPPEDERDAHHSEGKARRKTHAEIMREERRAWREQLLVLAAAALIVVGCSDIFRPSKTTVINIEPDVDRIEVGADAQDRRRGE